MTVAELIAKLQTMPADMRVLVLDECCVIHDIVDVRTMTEDIGDTCYTHASSGVDLDGRPVALLDIA